MHFYNVKYAIKYKNKLIQKYGNLIICDIVKQFSELYYVDVIYLI